MLERSERSRESVSGSVDCSCETQRCREFGSPCACGHTPLEFPKLEHKRSSREGGCEEEVEKAGEGVEICVKRT